MIFILNKLLQKCREIDIFNFIRGIALLCVIGLHTICVIAPTYPQIHYSKIYNTPAWISMWIFFCLSGYLLGKGFYNNKYQTHKNGIIAFYISRIIRIIPMYFLFLFILFLFYNPIWFVNNPKSIIHLLTFTYNGSPGIIGVGATWFISTIVQLYVLSPLIYKYILSKLNNTNNKIKFLWLLLLIALGLSYRLIINLSKLNYWNYCFTLSLANIDLFFAGMLLNSVTQNSKDNVMKKILRPASLLLLFTMIILYMYKQISMWFYSYICPTLTLIVMLLIMYSFDSIDKNTPKPLTLKTILINPIRFIEYLGIISFTFYLYHSNIIEISMKLLKNPEFPYAIPDELFYRCTFILMFILTLMMSIIMNKILEEPCNKLRKNMINKFNYDNMN